MEPITFEETLVHYKNKLSEILDYINGLSSQLDKEIECVNSSWKGRGAEACRIKIEDMKIELDKARLSIEHADTAVSEVLTIQKAIV